MASPEWHSTNRSQLAANISAPAQTKPGDYYATDKEMHIRARRGGLERCLCRAADSVEVKRVIFS